VATPSASDHQLVPARVPRRLGTGGVLRRSAVLDLLVLAAMLAIWSLAALYVKGQAARPEVTLPGPWSVVGDFDTISTFLGAGAEHTFGNALRVLWENTLTSVLRLLAGVVAGIAAGVLAGLLISSSRWIRAFAQVPVLLLRTIPLFALVPLFLAWFGGTDTGVVTFIGFAVFSMLVVNTIEAVRNVPPVLISFARVLGASRLRVYRTVIVPAIVPELIAAVRVVLGLSWALLLAGEFLGAQSGLGHILILAQQYSLTSRMILIVLLMMAYTVIVDRAFARLGGRFTRWQPQ
jgi:ABC-type nitrate/sulfonate/bicarbonate transport system permease component